MEPILSGLSDFRAKKKPPGRLAQEVSASTDVVLA
jgi:hypothetical protein